ncbi:MAG: hypothetical protein HIU57_06165 [Acidobacteria bacterium]|nr:hypothetical protein [Acidobacteriota bacterium]
MDERATTRQQLEEAVRALLPRTSEISGRLRRASSSTAGAGVGGLVTGYAWGWLRGRRSRRH